MHQPPAQPARPTAGAIAPFLVLGALGTGSAFVPFPRDALPQVLAGLAILVLVLIAGCVAHRRQERTWIDPVGPWLFFGTFVLLRDATGGAVSSVTSMAALPILWLALFGVRRDLWVTAALTFASFLGPVLLLDSAAYPVTDWRRAMLWPALSLLVAPVVQRVVQQLAEQTSRERTTAARLRGVLQGATLSSLITTDPYGTITSVNKGAEELLGYPTEELVGRRTLGFVHDSGEVDRVAGELGVPTGFGVFAHLARTRSPSRIWTYVHRDGRRLHVRLALTELADDDGRAIGYLGVAIDVTDTEEALRALTESEQRWRLVTDHLPEVSVLMLDEDLNISLIAGAGALRQGLAGAVGTNLADRSSPTNVRLLSDGVRAALDGGEPQVELAATATGAEHQITLCALPSTGTTHGPDRAPTQVLALARDVSAVRARERALTVARDRAETLLTSAPHGIAVTRLDGTVKQVNPALCDLLGRREADLVGASLADLDHGGATMADHLGALAAGRPSAPTEWPASHPDGVVHLAMGSTVLAGVDGVAEDEILFTFSDLSERHAHEQELSRLAEHDALTGLANRRRFARELRRHLESCRRDGARGALLMIDLDHFKAVNDQQGHATGDRLLVTVSDALSSTVRGADLVARLGGDEFAVLLTDTDQTGAEVVAGHVVTAIRTALSTATGPAGEVTASVGVAMVDQRRLDPDEFLVVADLAMYQAKESGRNRWSSALVEVETHEPRRPSAAS